MQEQLQGLQHPDQKTGGWRPSGPQPHHNETGGDCGGARQGLSGHRWQTVSLLQMFSKTDE